MNLRHWMQGETTPSVLMYAHYFYNLWHNLMILVTTRPPVPVS